MLWSAVRILLLFVATSLSTSAYLRAGSPIPPPPGPGDKCPVCGMFVARYHEWIASVTYEDGHTFYFDGAKDMFRYLRDHARYSRGRDPATIRSTYVTGYYSVEPIPAKEACYVTGSDMFGPMGHELIPHASEEEAMEFLKDHGGKAIYRFDDVTSGLLDSMDR